MRIGARVTSSVICHARSRRVRVKSVSLPVAMGIAEAINRGASISRSDTYDRVDPPLTSERKKADPSFRRIRELSRVSGSFYRPLPKPGLIIASHGSEYASPPFEGRRHASDAQIRVIIPRPSDITLPSVRPLFTDSILTLDLSSTAFASPLGAPLHDFASRQRHVPSEEHRRSEITYLRAALPNAVSYFALRVKCVVARSSTRRDTSRALSLKRSRSNKKYISLSAIRTTLKY